MRGIQQANHHVFRLLAKRAGQPLNRLFERHTITIARVFDGERIRDETAVVVGGPQIVAVGG